jgi:putative Mg2+ transporter-C (MgtC) family protein
MQIAIAPLLHFFAEVVVPLVAAACLGGVVGWERESGDKPAGLRTHMMVSLGAAVFTMAALRIISEHRTDAGDPSRIVMGVATGIGFLGAGSIIRMSGEVHGITTAAGIWVVGAVGACCGAGYYSIAAVAVVLSVLILALLYKLEPHISGSHHDKRRRHL